LRTSGSRWPPLQLYTGQEIEHDKNTQNRPAAIPDVQIKI
jgi:hypothetical protein